MYVCVYVCVYTYIKWVLYSKYYVVVLPYRESTHIVVTLAFQTSWSSMPAGPFSSTLPSLYTLSLFLLEKENRCPGAPNSAAQKTV